MAKLQRFNPKKSFLAVRLLAAKGSSKSVLREKQSLKHIILSLSLSLSLPRALLFAVSQRCPISHNLEMLKDAKRASHSFTFKLAPNAWRTHTSSKGCDFFTRFELRMASLAYPGEGHTMAHHSGHFGETPPKHFHVSYADQKY